MISINLQTADLEVLKALNHHQDLLQLEHQPSESLRPFEARLAGWRSESAYAEVRCWVVFAEDQKTIIGNAWVEAALGEENRHLVDYNILVLPDHRRRGIGRSLLVTVADYAQSQQRTTLIAGTSSTVPAGERFMERIGAAKGLETNINQLDLAELDLALLEGWLTRSKRLEAEFVLEFWDGRYPEHLLTDRLKLTEAIKDAPIGDLSREAHTASVAELRALEASLAARGITRWFAGIRHKATNEVVGFTEILYNPLTPTLLEQDGTGVLPSYRNRGLGRWLKTAMIKRVVNERPSVRFIRTGNATSNVPMLKINHELGFKPYTSDAWWEISLTKVKEYLGSRASIVSG